MTVEPNLVIQMGEVRDLIRHRAREDKFTFLDWQRNGGDTGWVCSIYVADDLGDEDDVPSRD